MAPVIAPAGCALAHVDVQEAGLVIDADAVELRYARSRGIQVTGSHSGDSYVSRISQDMLRMWNASHSRVVSRTATARKYLNEPLYQIPQRLKTDHKRRNDRVNSKSLRVPHGNVRSGLPTALDRRTWWLTLNRGGAMSDGREEREELEKRREQEKQEDREDRIDPSDVDEWE